MAAIEFVNLTGLKFQSKSPLWKQSSRCRGRTLVPSGSGSFSVPFDWKNRICARRIGILKCSLVDQQEKEPVVEEASEFSKEEFDLIDALIGIQGRGRSASPQQLQVCFHSLIWKFHESKCFFFFLTNVVRFLLLIDSKR